MASRKLTTFYHRYGHHNGHEGVGGVSYRIPYEVFDGSLSTYYPMGNDNSIWLGLGAYFTADQSSKLVIKVGVKYQDTDVRPVPFPGVVPGTGAGHSLVVGTATGVLQGVGAGEQTIGSFEVLGFVADLEYREYTLPTPLAGRYIAMHKVFNDDPKEANYYDLSVYIYVPDAPILDVSNLCTGSPLLTWDAITGTEYYIVERRIPAGTWAQLTTTTLTSYTDTTATPGTAYEWRVKAFGGGESSDPSNVVTGIPNQPPATPTGLTLTPVVNYEACTVSLAADWNNAARAASYDIERVGYTTTNVPTSDATLSAMLGRTDTYRVRAVNSCGASAWSDTVSATPDGIMLSPPTVTACQKCCEETVIVEWTAVSGATNYILEKNNLAVPLTIDESALRQYIDHYVDAGVTYLYTITPAEGCFPGTPASASLTVNGWLAPTPINTTWNTGECNCD